MNDVDMHDPSVYSPGGAQSPSSLFTYNVGSRNPSQPADVEV